MVSQKYRQRNKSSTERNLPNHRQIIYKERRSVEKERLKQQMEFEAMIQNERKKEEIRQRDLIKEQKEKEREERRQRDLAQRRLEQEQKK